MNADRKDYRIGLTYFVILIICVCSFFTTPDGDTLFYKLLKLFGISPGIRLGNASTLYIYMFIPLIAGIACIKGVFARWWNYGRRFAGYNAALRYMPLIVAVITFIMPAGVEAMYYRAVSGRNGLSAIVLYNVENGSDPLSNNFTGSKRTWSYDLTLQNYGDETQSFNVKFVDNWLSKETSFDVLIKQVDGEPMVFTLSPGQRQRFSGKFTDTFETDASSGSASFSQPMFVLQNETGQYRPAVIEKLPKRGFWRLKGEGICCNS